MSDSILKVVADNPMLMKAVRDAVEEQFNLDEIPTTMTNEAMGQVVRARVEGLKKIDKAFLKIASHASFAEKPATLHPGR